MQWKVQKTIVGMKETNVDTLMLQGKFTKRSQQTLKGNLIKWNNSKFEDMKYSTLDAGSRNFSQRPLI